MSSCFLLAAAGSAMSDAEYLKKRAALIVKHSHNDPTFATLHQAMETEDTLGSGFWLWKIDQYLYGQYTEFQPIYDAYREGKSFHDLYDVPQDALVDRAVDISKPPSLPDGFFSGNLPKDRKPGWSRYSNGKIYVAYEGDLTDPYMISYDLETKRWDGPYKAGHSTLSKNGRKLDGHGYPAFEQDVDGYFHVVFGGHGGEKEDGLNPHSIDTSHAGGRLKHVVSDRPNDISSFSEKADVSPFASYAETCKMANGDIYFFTRAGTHKSPWVYYKMKSGTQTFEPPVAITWPTPRKDDPMLVDMFYVKIEKASDTEILVTSMNHLCNFQEIHTPRHDDRFNAYYMKMDTSDDTFYNVEGEKLTLPITKAVADEKTLVYDSVKNGTIVNDTRGVVLADGAPAMSYELRFPEPREWKLATYNDGKWKAGQPMPETTNRTLVDNSGKPLVAPLDLILLSSDKDTATSAVIYRNNRKKTIFAIAQSSKASGILGQDWQIEKEHLVISGGGMQMEAVSNGDGEVVAVVINASKGTARRLYLWHEGEIRPRR
ncbi:BNR-4 repeat-containing protein [Pelagicoccus enzymogenes]|uniref:BNR-4 repeat-containing protein n=1 Tax=Pelagicoccus enzymogenes TaxID=2773457 RepID=UPI00280F9A5E|nr:BNR-4 repeat-containing protein [Pelagicoccus enzymogenes]MDQ8201262.1 BNR-4 repeat-containing protein [Pelagicoccus enzymogenes]